jgi:hypothetical protein
MLLVHVESLCNVHKYHVRQEGRKRAHPRQRIHPCPCHLLTGPYRLTIGTTWCVLEPFSRAELIDVDSAGIVVRQQKPHLANEDFTWSARQRTSSHLIIRPMCQHRQRSDLADDTFYQWPIKCNHFRLRERSPQRVAQAIASGRRAERLARRKSRPGALFSSRFCPYVPSTSPPSWLWRTPSFVVHCCVSYCRAYHRCRLVLFDRRLVRSSSPASSMRTSAV